MRLSEAIRLGSMLKPQAFGWYEDNGGTCAMGAAYEAAGLQMAVDTLTFPIVVRGPATCPACGHVIRLGDKVGQTSVFPIGAMVVHLNDSHRWTRERIADWVETIEAATVPAQEAETSPALVAVDPVASA